MDRDGKNETGIVEISGHRAMRSENMISSELQSLHAYWDGLRAGRKTPYRNEIDPRDMTCDVRNLFILENLGRGNIRFRLAGTSIVDAFGMELRGMNARAIMSAGSRESFTALIAEALEDPGVGYARLVSCDDNPSVWELCLLPLRSDFGMTDRIIGALVPVSGPARPNGMPLRFRIDTMSVDPISSKVRDFSQPNRVAGFAEAQRPFDFGEKTAPVRTGESCQLRAIDGGIAGEKDKAAPRRTGHLRLVKD